MKPLQPDDLTLEILGEEPVCAICSIVLTPVYENNGFDEPGAEHIEIIGFELCDHGREEL